MRAALVEQRPPERVAGPGGLDDRGSEGGEIGGARGGQPREDLVAAVTERGFHTGVEGTSRDGRGSIQVIEIFDRQTKAEPGTTAAIRHGKAPAAQDLGPAADRAPECDDTRADRKQATGPVAEGADEGGVAVPRQS